MVKNCTGCRMCEQKCPHGAITMEVNKEGFLYPKIDSKKCTNCNICKTNCPENNEIQKIAFKQKAYAAINKKHNILMNSSSGGIFSVIANEIIKEDGYVCGCVLNKELKAIHIVTQKKDDIEKMRGSKYVQSDTRDTYTDIKKKLNEGKKVLYTGTPCQIAGLKKFLNKDYDNLLTIDIICHGVPSPKMFDKYIEYLSNKYKSSIREIKFRNKDKKGSAKIYPYELKVTLTSGKIVIVRNPCLDSYGYMFHKILNLRQSCYNCSYANMNRMGDITLGDYWGIEKYSKGIDVDNGVSLIIINNEKGKSFFESKITDKIIYEEHDLNNVKAGNVNLNKPVNKPVEREKIYVDLDEYGYKYVIKKYCRKKDYILMKIKSYIPLHIKDSIKIIRNKIS